MEDENKTKSSNLEGQTNASVDEESLPKHDIGNPSLFKALQSKKVECIENDVSNSFTSNVPEKNATNGQFHDEKQSKNDKKDIMTPGKKKLFSWLNKQMKIEMTDGRVLVGIFLCTDRDANVILGSCTEYLNPEVCGFTDEPRILGLVMVPGRHIVSIHHDDCDTQFSNIANMVMPEDKEPAGV